MTTPFAAPDLEKFRASNKLGSWTPGLVALASGAPFSPSLQVLTTLSSAVSDEAGRGTIRWGRLHDLLALFTIITGGAALDDYQVMQGLAPSRFDRRSLGGLGDLYRRLERTLYAICPAVGPRLASFAATVDLFLALVPARREFEARVRALSSSQLALVLLAPGLTFMSVLRNPENFLRNRLGPPPDEATPETIATGASYVLTTFNHLVGFKERFISAIQGPEPRPEPTYELIGTATTLFSIDEAEVDVFRAGYKCKQTASATWSVDAPTETIGRAIELGYIDSSHRALLHRDILPTPTSDAPLLADVASEFSRMFGESFFRIVDGPPRRIRFELPKDAAREIGASLLLGDGLYVEEMQWIAATCYELVAHPRELRGVPITAHLTLWDTLLISRIFRLISVGWSEAMDRLGDDTNAKLNSSVRVISHAALSALICAFGFPAEKASDYINVFTWDTSVRGSYADLQYRPFLRVGDTIAIPLGIHEHSDILRNALLSQQKRLSSGTLPDLVTESLAAAIRKTHTQVASGTNFKFRGEESDIDVAWRLEDTLFVFECKNTLHPCSSFEMRTTLDQLDKAARQLSRLRRLWGDAEFRRLLEGKLAYSLQGIVQLRTGIVLSHRIYAGADYKEHPVRHLHALAQFIRHGEGALMAGDKEHRLRWWSGSHLQAADLERYLDPDSPAYATQWLAQVGTPHTTELGDVRVIRTRYPLDMKRFAEAVGAPPDFGRFEAPA